MKYAELYVPADGSRQDRIRTGVTLGHANGGVMGYALGVLTIENKK